MPEYNPAFTTYSTYQMRLCTFNLWKRACSNIRLTREMADAGFFYCGDGYNCNTRCFSCKGILELWEDNDDPWEQHALWFPQCHYLKAARGTDFIQSVRKFIDC